MSKNDRSYAVGVDVGGTTIKSGTVRPDGTILDQVVVDARPREGPIAVLQQINLSIKSLLDNTDHERCVGIGIGAPGVITAEDGMVHYPPNFVGWTDVDVVTPVKSSFQLKVEIENDANAAALAEARFGAGVDHKDFVFVIWGTGVGGGIIIDRKIYRGPFGGAGEIGHVSINHEGPRCNCGNRGCIEAYIGQRYLSDRTRKLISQADVDEARSKIIDLVGGKLDQLEPSIISKAAEQNDPLASSVLKEAGRLLGFALASVVNVLDIRTVIIGGGISAAPSFVFDEIESGVKSRVLKPHQPGIRILRAQLGNSAGIIGAASLVL